ncbi:MAG: hypothetical protein K1X78_19535 [Verrucomicrobiaceae bacterium]|nr:hypothetical protein [Verrucomicrobiaceae bacterium]
MIGPTNPAISIPMISSRLACFSPALVLAFARAPNAFVNLNFDSAMVVANDASFGFLDR